MKMEIEGPARKSTITQHSVEKDKKNDKPHRNQQRPTCKDKKTEENITTIHIPDDYSPTPVSCIGTWNVSNTESQSTATHQPLYSKHGKSSSAPKTITMYPNTIITSSNSAFKNVQSSTKISPSSIPNPNPSVSANKSSDTGNYPTYGGYLYSIPGYSAFQPLQYPSINILGGTECAQSVPMMTIASEPPNTSDYIQLTSSNRVEDVSKDDNTSCLSKQPKLKQKNENTLAQTDFEEHFRTKIVPTVSEVMHETVVDCSNTHQEKSADVIQNKEPLSVLNLKQKTERFSLITSIPISKIDMKSVNVNLPPDGTVQSVYHLQTTSPEANNYSLPVTLETNKTDQTNKVTIRSNILIRSSALPQNVGYVSPEVNNAEEIATTGFVPTSEHGTLVCKNAPQTVQDLVPETQNETVPTAGSTPNLPIFAMQPQIALQTETSSQVINVVKKAEQSTTKQLVLIPNRTTTNQKLLLAISQSQAKANQLVLKKTTTHESKNHQAPSRPSIVNKKVKDTLLLAESLPQTSAHKVVALKRLHQDNGDEDDFENLITENQIYGNKIVVKERSHGIVLQEQVKSACINLQPNLLGSPENLSPAREPNGYLQPSIVYLSNVQIPTNVGNIMLINHTPPIYKALQDVNAPNNDQLMTDNLENNTPNSGHLNIHFHPGDALRNSKSPATNLQLTKASDNLIKINGNSILNLPGKSTINSAEVLLKPITPKILGVRQMYRAPVLHFNVDGMPRRKVGRPPKSKEEMCIGSSNLQNLNHKEFIALQINTESDDYDRASLAHPFNKALRNNLVPKCNEELFSMIDLAEKKRKLRRLKHLGNKDISKDLPKNKMDKSESGKSGKVNITAELQKEFARARGRHRNTSESQDSDSDVEETADYDYMQELWGQKKETRPLNTAEGKLGFLKMFGLTTQAELNEIELEILERRSKIGPVNSAITVDLDCVFKFNCVSDKRFSSLLESKLVNKFSLSPPQALEQQLNTENRDRSTDKLSFFSQLQLAGVSRKYKDDYEETWKVIIDERKKRSGESAFTKYCDHSYSKWKQSRNSAAINTHARGQLQIMNEITKSVNENNNLIKKRLDGQLYVTPANEFDSNVIIPILAEHSITELDKLSKMADNSLKIFVGSEHLRNFQPVLNSNIYTIGGLEVHNNKISNEALLNSEISHQKITIPSVAKVISLSLSLNDPIMMDTSPAKSMDEPQNSAALVKVDSQKVSTIFEPLPVDTSASFPSFYITYTDTSEPLHVDENEIIENSTLTDDTVANYHSIGGGVIMCPRDNKDIISKKSSDQYQWRWPGVEVVMESYRRYDAECQHERTTLMSENNRLKREVAARRVEVTATNDTIRRLLADKQSSMRQHEKLQKSVAKIMDVIDYIKKTHINE